MINYLDKALESLNFKRLFLPIWQYEFDKKKYFKEFKLSKAILCFLFAMTLAGFGDYIINSHVKGLLEFLKLNFKINEKLLLIVSYMVVLNIARVLLNRLRYGYLITLNSLLYSIVIIYVFNDLIKKNELSDHVECIAFGILITLIIYTSKWSLYYVRRDTRNREYQFVIDNNSASDLFNYSGLSRELIKFIHNTETEQAFNVGVIGSWGDGKTFFSNLIKNELEVYGDDYIIIEFNPWQYDSSSLIDGFFSEFISSTKFLNKEFTSDIEKYVSHISDSYENDKLNLSLKLVTLMGGSKSLFDLKKEISCQLKLSRKKIIVIVDDTDRLDSHELMSVLKLIRNSANFANTFFIAGIDIDYVNSKIDNAKYIEKIFNVLVSLPILSSDLYEKTILDKFKSEFNDSKLIDSLSALLTNQSFAAMIRNLRQVNRLINSFKIAYNKLRGNIDYTDLLILEAIKSSNTIVYNRILNNEEFINSFLEDRSSPDPCQKELNIDKISKSQISHIKELLKILISNKNNIKGYSKENRLLYFNYANYGLSIVDFFEIIEKSNIEIADKFNDWLSESEMIKKDLFSILLIYLNDNKTKNLTPALLELKDLKFSRDVITSGFLNKMSLPDELYKLLRDVLDHYEEDNFRQNKTVYLEVVSDIVLKILRLNGEEVKVLNSDFKNDVLELYINTLKYLINKNEDVKKVFEIFILSTVEINNNFYIYDDRIVKIVKDYVSKDNNFIKLIEESLIIEKWSGSYDDYTREIIISNYIKILFSKSETDALISKSYTAPNIPHIEFLKNYIDEFYSYNRSKTFSMYINDEDLHNQFLKYYNK